MNIKKFLVATALLAMTFFTTGQSQNVTVQAAAYETDAHTTENISTSTPKAEKATLKKASSIFETMPKRFAFSSGAGAWATEINLKKDGTFTGQYHDSNMGETGPGYPGGTVYICNFSGKFSNPKKINKYTYSMKLKKLKSDKKPGKIYYKNNIRYITSKPYGLDNADKFMIYSPGIKLSKLPDGFVSWLNAFMDVRTTKSLSKYGIYNVKGEAGFVAVSN